MNFEVCITVLSTKTIDTLENIRYYAVTVITIGVNGGQFG